MKFAFSTLACPAWSVDQIIDAATRLGYDGVELRLLDGEFIDVHADSLKIREAAAVCRARDVEVCAFATSCSFNHGDPKERERQVADLLRWIDLARDTQVPILRVFGGATRLDHQPAPSDAAVDEWVTQSLRHVAPAAERAGVVVALETHDAFSSSRRVAKVLRDVASTHIAALWDSHHPYRVGESVADVMNALGGWIVHVHVKDARRVAPGSPDWQLVPVGEGEVPVRDQLQGLARAGYMGYISVEWEKKWHPDLAEPEIALPRHISWLKDSAGLDAEE